MRLNLSLNLGITLTPPATKPDWRLQGNRTVICIFGSVTLVCLLGLVISALNQQWVGVVMLAVFAPLFGAMCWVFARAKLELHGDQLWQRNVLGRWQAPVQLGQLEHVEFVRRPGSMYGSNSGLVLTFDQHGSSFDQLAAEAIGRGELNESVTALTRAAVLERERAKMEIATLAFRRGQVERMLAPWALARSDIVVGDDLRRRFERYAPS